MQNLKKATRLVLRRAAKHSDINLTDQSLKKLCCINNIVEKFSKTGLLPENTKIPQYLDMSHVPTLEESYDVTIRASKAFYALPSQLRKLIDNDPSELLNFIANDENKEICLKYGLIEKIKRKLPTNNNDGDSAIIVKKEVKDDQENSSGQDATSSSTT